MEKESLEFLGTGTSQGVPIIGCKCEVCSSRSPYDKRYRSSVLVTYGGLQILVDAGPDFRSQALRSGISHLDAILLTHNHKDHTGGLDDLRSLNYIDRTSQEIYCEKRVVEALKGEYPYAFAEEKYPGAPEWHVHTIDERPFIIRSNSHERKLTWIHDVGYRYILPSGEIAPTGSPVDEAERANDPTLTGNDRGRGGDGVEIIPIRGYHHTMPVLGFRFGSIAYITDMSSIPEEELEKLKGLDYLTLNTVGYKPHHSHFSLYEALELADRIRAGRTYLTHLSHNFPRYPIFRKQLQDLCKQKGIHSEVLPSYDGLVIG